MSTAYKILTIIIIAIIAISTVWTYAIAQKQRHYVKDNGLNPTTQRHRLIANPVLIAYVLFPIAVVIGAAILMYYYF